MKVRVRFISIAAILTMALWVISNVFAAPEPRQSGTTQTSSKANSVPLPEDRIDINHASVDELLKVPGMTSSWAGRIVRFRPYRTKADLVERGVLPSDVYDRIKDYVIAHRDNK